MAKPKSTPGPGSERVKSWIYGVLNPWIDQLELQIELVDKGNPTFRWKSRQLEFVRPVRDLFDKQGRILLDDFERGRSSGRNWEDAHVKCVGDLEVACIRAIDAILNSHFPAKVKERAASYSEEFKRAEYDAVQSTAQHVVNAGIDVHPNDTDAAWWSRVATEFLNHHWADELVQLRHAKRDFVEKAVGLKESLAEVRNSLVDEYDVPAAYFG